MGYARYGGDFETALLLSGSIRPLRPRRLGSLDSLGDLPMIRPSAAEARISTLHSRPKYANFLAGLIFSRPSISSADDRRRFCPGADAHRETLSSRRRPPRSAGRLRAAHGNCSPSARDSCQCLMPLPRNCLPISRRASLSNSAIWRLLL